MMSMGEIAVTLPLEMRVIRRKGAWIRRMQVPGFALFSRLTLLALCLLMVTQESAGATLTDTLSETESGVSNINDTTWAAGSFTTTATDYVITAVTLKLSKETGVTGGFSIDIYSSESGNPGSLVAAAGTGSAANLGPSSADFSINNLSITLSPGTEYFLLLRGTSITGGNLQWPYAVIPGSTLRWAETINSGNDWTSGTESPYLMRIDAATGPSACGDGIPYIQGDWHMLALPCVPTDPATVANTFGDGSLTDLTSSDYGVAKPIDKTGWTIFNRTVGNTPAYVMLGAGDTLVTGTGYWFKSYQSTLDGVLALEGSATPTPVSQAEGCASANGCVAITVSTPSASTNRYNLVGNPFPYAVDWSQVRVRIDGNATTYTPCQAAKIIETSCSGSNSNLNPAVISNVISIWDGSVYLTYDDITSGMEGKLLYFTSFWVNVLPGAAGKTVELLIPALPATGQANGFATDRIAATHRPWFLGWLDWLVPPAAAEERFVPGRHPTERTVPRASQQGVTAAPAPLTNPTLDLLITDGITRQGLSPQAAQRAAHAQAIAGGREWFLRLKVDEPGKRYKDHNTVIGQLLTAQDQYDSHDLAEMDPFASPYMTLVIPHPEWGAQAGNYASDYRQAAGNKQWVLKPATWTVELRAEPGDRQVVLNWEGNTKILRASRLRDLQTGKVINPTDKRYLNGYAFTMTGGSRRLAWEFLGQRR